LARTIAVASGKGGVGKSTVALGTAMAAAARGLKVALVDADLGLANLDILAGIQPRFTAADWLAGRASLSQCFTLLAPRAWLLPGASGVSRMADLEPMHRARLLEGLARVAAHVDLMVIDLGAGIGAGTLDIASAADRLLVVATPEPTSIADAYGFMKSCARRGRERGASCAITMARGAEDATMAAGRLARTCERHLGLELPCVGWVPMDATVGSAVRVRVPLLAHAPACAAARAIEAIEARLAGLDVASPAEREVPGFVTRLARRLGVQWGGPAAAAGLGLGAAGVSAHW
jgi:flagellar biosynthesis protein FlhG